MILTKIDEPIINEDLGAMNQIETSWKCEGNFYTYT